MKYLVKQNKTSQLATLFAQDSSSTTGTGLGSVVFNSSGITAYYFREGDSSSTAISLQTMTIGTWASGGLILVDGTNMKGVLQLGIPNNALTALGSVTIYIQGVTNLAPIVLELQVVAFDPNDAVHLGISALPNTACTTNASLITSGSGTDQLTVSGGIASADAKKINAVSTSSVTTVNANVGTTQAVVFNANNFQKVSLNDILATTLTETSGQLAGGFKQWFNVATPTGTVNSIPNAVAGASGGLFIAGTNDHLTITNNVLVSGTTTFTGAIASNGGATFQSSSGAGMTIISSASTTSGLVVGGTGAPDIALVGTGVLNADLFGRVLGNTGVSGNGISGVGVQANTIQFSGSAVVMTSGKLWVLDSSGNAVAPSASALSTAQWTNTLATNLGTLAGHDPGAALASQTNITAGTITTVGTTTNLTNLPSIPSNWLTATGIAANALNGKGDWLTVAGYTAPNNAGIATIISGLASLSTQVGTPMQAGASVLLASNGMDAVDCDGFNPRQALAMLLATHCGQVIVSGSTITISAAGSPSTTRLQATGDPSGDRTSITLTAPT